MPERGHRFNPDREPEPATFKYLRQAGHGFGSAVALRVEDALESNNLGSVGKGLVFRLGWNAAKDLALTVEDLAKAALAEKPNDRVARSALRWSGRAQRRITEHGWQDPEPNYPRLRSYDHTTRSSWW